MDVNYGSISGQVAEYGYTGAYTGGGVTYPYQLTSHIANPDPNSVLKSANFATTDTPIEFRIISDFDSAKMVVDWQAFSDNQLWGDDINTLAAVTVNATADTTDSATIGWKTPDGTTGQFTATVSIDGTAATISTVSVPTAGTYTPGDSLSFTVNWNEAVDVTGTPALNLTIGGSARQANYASGTGTSATVFNYTVQSGEEGAVSITSLTLDGGTIKDAVGNDATLTLNSIGDTSGVLVDGVAPSISIFPLTTLDTSPIVSGSAGDATSLTLVVTGVGTYNPTPSGGSWSQQLPTVALGDYPMTLNGEDAAGNAAVEATGTLSIVTELPSAVFALIGPAIEPVISNALEDSIG